MFELSRWAQRVSQDVQTGRLTSQYTYEEFQSQVKKIPPGTDFSRLAKDAMETKLFAQAAAAKYQAAAAKYKRTLSDVNNHEDDMESDIEVLEPSMLTYERGKENDSNVVSSSNKRPKSMDRTEPLPAQTEKVTPREGVSSENTEFAKKMQAIKDRAEPPPVPSMKATLSESTPSKKSACNYGKMSMSDLQKRCEAVGLAKSGSKAVLMERLNGPHPPPEWLDRKLAGQYVPSSHDCGATALLVGLYLLEVERGSGHDGFFEKDVLYSKAEELCITKNPFSGGTTQTGPYHYDGWSNMSKLLEGDPPLVLRRKNRFKLSRCCSTAGYQLGMALHTWCHQHNKCNCGRVDLE
jgi:hypothetical protein